MAIKIPSIDEVDDDSFKRAQTALSDFKFDTSATDNIDIPELDAPELDFADNNTQDISTANLTQKQQDYVQDLGFRPEDVPEFRSDNPQQGLLGRVFDVLQRPEAAVTGFLSQGLESIRNEESLGETIGSAVQGAGEGLLGDKRYTAGTLYSQLVDDPYAEETFSEPVLNQLRGGGSRFIANIGGGLALDPTTYIGVGAARRLAKLGKTIGSALPGAVDKASDVGKLVGKVSNNTGLTQQLDNVRTLLDPAFKRGGFDKDLANLTRKQGAFSEVERGLKGLLTNQLSDQDYRRFRSVLKGRLKDSSKRATDVNNIIKGVDRAKAQIDDLAEQGVDFATPEVQQQLYKSLSGFQDVDKQLEPIGDLRRVIDEVATPKLKEAGLLDEEVAEQGMGTYLRSLYEKTGGIEDPQAEQILEAVTKSEAAIGKEAGMLKKKKSDIERFLDFVRNPQKKLDELDELSQASVKDAQKKYQALLDDPDVDTTQLQIISRRYDNIVQAEGSKKAADKTISKELYDIVDKETVREIAEFGERASRGLSQDASLVLPTTIRQAFDLAEKHSFFNTVAKDENVVSKVAKEGFQKIPDTKSYGALAGKHVIEPLAKDIITMVGTKPDALSKLLEDTTRVWKQLKLFSPLNTATNFRNMTGQLVFMTLGDEAPDVFRAAKKYMEGLREIEKGGKYFDELLEAGALSNGFALRQVQDVLQTADTGALGRASKAIGEQVKRVPGGKALTPEGFKIPGTPFGWGQAAFQFTEEGSKVGLYKWYREVKNYSKEKALEAVNKVIPDYAQLPQGIQRGRILGMKSSTAVPFLSFKYFATKLALETMFQKPGKLAGVDKLRRGIESFTLDKEDEQNLPLWMKEKRQNLIRLPWLDSEGNPKYLDMTYLFPLGDAFTGLAPEDVLLGNPFARTMFELSTNRNLYFDRPVADPAAPPAQQLGQQASFAFNQLGPTTPAIPGTYQSKKLFDALSGRPDPQGRPQDIPGALLDVSAGIKTREVDPVRQRQINEAALDERIRNVRSNIEGIRRDQSLTPEEKEAQIQPLLDEIVRLRTQARTSGTYPSF